MGLPVFFPAADIALKLPGGKRTTVRELCRRAGVVCRVTGIAAGRRVRLTRRSSLGAVRRPGALGEVWIGVPRQANPGKEALLALGLLAYGVFDYAARESLRGLPESRPVVGRGRPRSLAALSNAERQRRYRARKRQG